MTKVIEYFQCCYCPKFEGGNGKQVPKTVGHFKVKIINGYILVFRCDRCMKSFRVTMRGGILQWDDMTWTEKQAWKRKEKKGD